MSNRRHSARHGATVLLAYGLIAVKPIKEESNASIVPRGTQILIRTHPTLWCIGDPETGKTSTH